MTRPGFLTESETAELNHLPARDSRLQVIISCSPKVRMPQRTRTVPLALWGPMHWRGSRTRLGTGPVMSISEVCQEDCCRGLCTLEGSESWDPTLLTQRGVTPGFVCAHSWVQTLGPVGPWELTSHHASSWHLTLQLFGIVRPNPSPCCDRTSCHFSAVLFTSWLFADQEGKAHLYDVLHT